MHPLIETHRSQLRSLVTRYGLSSIRVFGSMARNDASSTSDVDLLVESKEPVPGFSLGATLMDAHDILGRKVDIVTIQALHPLMRSSVLQEAVLL